MAEVIDFAERKAIKDQDRSCHYVSLDVFIDENFLPWARVSNIDMQDMDADWHRHISELLRRLAWISDEMAAAEDGRERAVASITAFDSGRVHAIDNDDLVQTAEQVDWISEQMELGVAEIRAALEANTP